MPQKREDPKAGMIGIPKFVRYTPPNRTIRAKKANKKVRSLASLSLKVAFGFWLKKMQDVADDSLGLSSFGCIPFDSLECSVWRLGHNLKK